jgi:hypothetical protein
MKHIFRASQSCTKSKMASVTELYTLLFSSKKLSARRFERYASSSAGNPYELDSIPTVSSSREEPYDFANTSETNDKSVVPAISIQALAISPLSTTHVCTVCRPLPGSAPLIIYILCRRVDITIFLGVMNRQHKRTAKIVRFHGVANETPNKLQTRNQNLPQRMVLWVSQLDVDAMLTNGAN